MSEEASSVNKKPVQRRTFRRTQGPQTNTKKFQKNSDSKTNGSSNSQGGNDDDDDETCVICTEKLHYVALTPCNHKTCHRCSFRQLALFQKKACLICRTETERMIFSDDIHSKYNDFDSKTSFIKNEKYGIDFTSKEVADTTLLLSRYNCSLCESDDDKHVDHKSYGKYKEHLTSHNRTICMICATHNYLFPSELKIYTPNQLKIHLSRGDSEGFKGHPMCAFCSGQRFYSDDELYLHMREKHEKCHICDKLDPKSPQYFKNYNQLFSHFQNSHYICTVPSCLDAKFVVFGDELELQAHILKEHGDIIRGKPKFFQSELSTFMSGPSRVVRENNDFNGDSLLRDNTSKETPEMKRTRLEERAKYYLNNSADQFAIFQSFNKDYDKGKIRATDLLNAYKTLFTSAEANIYILIHNLSEIYPKESKKFKELDTIYAGHEEMEQRKQDLPSLNSDPFMRVRGSWGNAGGATRSTNSSRSSSRTDLKNLPTLKAPSPNHDPFSSPYQVKTFKNTNRPIVRSLPRTTIPSQASSHPRGTPVATNNSVSFSASYLQNKNSSSGASLNHMANNNRNKLADLDLPSLPTPKKKVHPPVNKVSLPNPKSWGKEPAKQNGIHLEDDLAGLVIQTNGKGKKGKGKQKQLLYHIGV
ncbi:E3 ubiquitin-protein ligase Hel2p [Monosporozyma servazzii]